MKIVSIEAIKVFSRIENIFNKYYEILDGYAGAPRTWIIGVSYEFYNRSIC